MKIGNVLITTTKAQETQDAQMGAVNQRLDQLSSYLADNIEKIHAEEKDNDTSVMNLNKSLNAGGLMGLNIFTTKINENWKEQRLDMETLRFWSSELPLAPQAIEHIVKSSWSRGYKFAVNNGKVENPALLNEIENFFKYANSNRQSLKSLLQTLQRHSMRVGNGYLEKIYTRKGDKLAEVRIIKPWNVIVRTDAAAEKEGNLKILGYAKVDKVDNIDLTKIPNEAKLEPHEVIHDKYIDEGDAYGVSPFARNTELTKFIINVLNRNQKKFTNEIRHSLHVKLGLNATQADADIFIAQYRTRYLGKNNYGMPLITFGGIEVETWDMNEQEFDFETFMKDIGQNHAPTLLNVAPSEILNHDSKYSNSTQGHVTTVLNTIYEWQTKLEQIINDEIIPEIEGILAHKNGKFRAEALPTYRFVLERENLFTMYEHLDSITRATLAAILSVNEARSLIDPNSLKDVTDEEGQPADWAKAYYLVTGKGVNVLSEEYFAGVDDGEDVSKKLLDDGDNQVGPLAAYLKQKDSNKNTDKKE